MSSAPLKRPFSVFMTYLYIDAHTLEQAKLFPLFWYEQQVTHNLFSLDNEEYSKEYAISDVAFNKFKEKYGQYITKEDLFYYIFGVLNSKKYQEL